MTKHILMMETTGKAQAGSGKGGKRRTAGLIATVALGLSLLTGGIISQLRNEAPASPQVQPALELSVAASERERNLILEQNILHEITPTDAGSGMLPGPAKFHGDDH
jgi:hypothetical protein